MKKKKLYILMIVLVFILVLAVGGTCQTCLAWWSGKAIIVGDQTQKAINSIVKKPVDEDRKVTWVDEKGDPIKDKEETGSSQSEDIEDLEKFVEGSISLKGKVNSDILGSIELTIDGDTNTVQGKINGMGWTEEILTGDNGDGSEDHHHTKNCEVIFNGTFFGSIDANGKILAHIVGAINGKDGECKQLVKNKSESFTLNGIYSKDFNNAKGDIKPQGYSWTADKV